MKRLKPSAETGQVQQRARLSRCSAHNAGGSTAISNSVIPSRADIELTPMRIPIPRQPFAHQVLKRQTVVRLGDAGFNDVGCQLRQARNLAGLPQIHAFGSCDFRDRLKLPIIEQPLPVVRQTQRPDQWRSLRRLALGALRCRLHRKRLRRIQRRDDFAPHSPFDQRPGDEGFHLCIGISNHLFPDPLGQRGPEKR